MPVFGAERKVIGVLIREYRAEAEEKLAFLESASSGMGDAMYHLWEQDFGLSDKISEAVIIADRYGIVHYCNQEAEKIYHRMGHEGIFLGQNIAKLKLSMEQFPECDTVEAKPLSIGNSIFEIKYFYRKERKDICLILHDVTNEKQFERRLRMQSFLTSEMNHRIKNNLQTVASLLNIQSYKITDEDVKQMFQESVNRVLSIAEVHNALSVSETEKIEMLALIEKICYNITRMLPVKYKVTGDVVYLSASKASTFGLVVNELVQNVVKHARPVGNVTKSVTIDVKNGNQNVNVEIYDNGGGIKEDTSQGIGLQIVKRLVTESLSGEIGMYNKEMGVSVNLSFPKE